MSQGHLVWIAEEREYPGEKQYYFIFDPVMGLLDLDMHRIGEDGFAHLSAPDGETTAHLVAPPFVTMAELEEALRILAEKGQWKRVRVTVRPL